MTGTQRNRVGRQRCAFASAQRNCSIAGKRLINDGVVDRLQHRQDEFSRSHVVGLAERYRGGGCLIHVHISMRDDFISADDVFGPRSGNAPRLIICTASFRARDHGGGVVVFGVADRLESADLDGLCHASDEWWESVLVPVVQNVEGTEQFSIASCVCLKALDCCETAGRHLLLGTYVWGGSAR